MKKVLKENKNLIIFWLLIIIIVSVLLSFLKHPARVNNIIQAIAIITLVIVTGFYARETTKLVEEQKLERDLKFNERRLHSFYNPFIFYLEESMLAFKGKLKETEKYLMKPRQEIFYLYSYMVSLETKENINKFFSELSEKAEKEHNKELEENSRSKLFRLLKETRKRLHEERVEIVNYISENYSFPEKENQRSET